MITSTRQKSLLVTGASRRLGLLTCEEFLLKGNRVCAVTRALNSDLAKLLTDYPDDFMVCECSTYDKLGAAKVISQFADISFDVLINNASYFVEDADTAEEKANQYQLFFETHMLFPMLLSDWFAQQAESDGRSNSVIVNLSDIYAVKPTSVRSLYCSTKAGLESLTQSLATKFAPNIRVNSIQPGPLAFLPEHSDVEKADVMSQTPLQVEGGFGVIVETIEFIIENHFLTGSSVKVDGGRSLVR